MARLCSIFDLFGRIREVCNVSQYLRYSFVERSFLFFGDVLNEKSFGLGGQWFSFGFVISPYGQGFRLDGVEFQAFLACGGSGV